MAATDKVLRNSGAVLSVTFYADGQPIDADATVTYAAADEWGDSVQSGNATKPGATTGVYEFVLTPQADLKKLSITWTGDFSAVQQSVVTYAEIVGNHLFSVADARNFRPQGSVPLGLMNSETKYPTASIIDHREEITDLFTVLLGYSPVERSHFDVYSGTGRDFLYVKKYITKINRIDVDGTTINDTITFGKYGRLHREDDLWPLGEANITAQYEAGLQNTPGPIQRAALVLLHNLMIGSDIMDRTITHTDETGTYRLSVPDRHRNRNTGIPYVDSVIANYADDWLVV